MAKIRIQLDRDGMDDMLTSSEVSNAVHDIAEDIATTAYNNMPTHYTGPLAYEVEVDTIEGWKGTYGSRRAAASVRTTHMLGPALERKYAPLRKALKGAG
jgi:hypothetical protein